MKKMTYAVFVGCAVILTGCSTAPKWQSTLQTRLPEYGHRNWIVVADSAYPKQSSPGIETIYTDAEQLEVLEAVLDAVDDAQHVQPVIMLDAELDAVSEAASPGVENYRTKLKELCADREIKVMPHEDIIRKLDEGSALFNILVLKTELTIPYTSVFIELDCGYWNAEKEKELRDAIKRR